MIKKIQNVAQSSFFAIKERSFKELKTKRFKDDMYHFFIYANSVIIIKELLLLYSKQEQAYNLAIITVQTFFHLFYFLVEYKIKCLSSSKIIFQQVLFLVQLVTIFYQLLTNQESLNVAIMTIYAFKAIQSQPIIIIKIFYLISFSFSFGFVIKPINVINLVSLILILIFCIFSFEIKFHQIWSQLMLLMNITQSIPEAMCIIDQRDQKILYSNKKFKNLQQILTINEVNKQQDTSQEYIHFLQKLQLQKIQEEEDWFKLDDYLNNQLDEKNNEDIYQIKNVQFQKGSQRNIPKICELQQKGFQDLDEFQLLNSNICTLIEQMKNYQSDFQPRVRSFQFDIYFQLQLNHQPSSQLYSAIRKQNKSLNNVPNLSLRSKNNSMKLQQDPLVQEDSYTYLFGSKRKNSYQTYSILKHKIKFMLSAIDNYYFNDNQLPIKTLFFHDLSSSILKTKVKKLEQVKKNLLRSISHELATYLNGAYNCLHQFKDENDKNDLIDEALNYLTLQIYKISDFQDFQNIIQNQFQIENEKFELEESINHCVDLVKHQIEQKKININIDVPQENGIHILGDQQRFYQIILNLLSNSIKFTELGDICIQVKLLDEKIDQNILEISVMDTGIGMEEEKFGILAQKVYKALVYYQLLGVDNDEKISNDSVGIGMGLIVCKAIVQKMAPPQMNKIFVESTKNKGTKFFFFLNYIYQRKTSLEVQLENNFSDLIVSTELQQGEVIQVSKSTKVQKYRRNQQQKLSSFLAPQLLMQSSSFYSPQQNQYYHNFNSFTQSDHNENLCQCNQILVVDDEQFNINALVYILKKFELVLKTAYNGKQAVDILTEKISNQCSTNCQIFSCILMDINMPVMSGWDAIVEIRSIEKKKLKRRIPAIAITAFCGINDQEKCIELGFDYVIIKPITIAKLQRACACLNLKLGKLSQ